MNIRLLVHWTEVKRVVMRRHRVRRPPDCTRPSLVVAERADVCAHGVKADLVPVLPAPDLVFHVLHEVERRHVVHLNVERHGNLIRAIPQQPLLDLAETPDFSPVRLDPLAPDISAGDGRKGEVFQIPPHGIACVAEDDDASGFEYVQSLADFPGHLRIRHVHAPERIHHPLAHALVQDRIKRVADAPNVARGVKQHLPTVTAAAACAVVREPIGEQVGPVVRKHRADDVVRQRRIANDDRVVGKRRHELAPECHVRETLQQRAEERRQHPADENRPGQADECRIHGGDAFCSGIGVNRAENGEQVFVECKRVAVARPLLVDLGPNPHAKVPQHDESDQEYAQHPREHLQVAPVGDIAEQYARVPVP